jgi:hypothetical protein
MGVCAQAGAQAYDEYGRDDYSSRTKNGSGGADKGGPTLSKLGSNSTAQLYPKDDGEGRAAAVAMPPASVMTRLILIMVWRKLIRNPNTYSSLIGVVWSLVSYRLVRGWEVGTKTILSNPSILIGSNPRMFFLQVKIKKKMFSFSGGASRCQRSSPGRFRSCRTRVSGWPCSA